MDEQFTQERIVEIFSKQEEIWREAVTDMNKKLTKIADTIELLNDVYAKHQEAIELYHKMLRKLKEQERKITKIRSDRTKFYTQQSQYAFKATEIRSIVDGELADDIFLCEVYEGFCSYMKETMANIASIKYGIKDRIALEQLLKDEMAY